jgi:hypothetical protein
VAREVEQARGEPQRERAAERRAFGEAQLQGAAAQSVGPGQQVLRRIEGGARAVDDLAREIGKMEGVSGTWTAREYATLGLPAPDAHHLVGDVMFEAAPGYCFGDAHEGGDHGTPKYLGNHGQRPTWADNAAFFLAAGPGLARGREIATIRSRDVAPTLAHLLAVVLPDVEGAPIEAALG